MPLIEGTGESVAGLLFQDLGIPLECLNPITRTLADFAQQAMMYSHPGTPGVFRLFCQEKMLRGGNPAKAMRPRSTVAGPEIIPQPHPEMSGGWGYFLVERNADFRDDRLASALNVVDLYLYQEGK